MVDAIAPAEARAQVRPARRGDQAPLAWIRLRSAPAQPPRSHSMCQDCEHPFIQWSIARLDERECDSDEQEEPCQCSSGWRRRNGQLIPDAVGGEAKAMKVATCRAVSPRNRVSSIFR